MACLAPCPNVGERVAEIFEIFGRSSSQIRAGAEAVLGLDWNVVELIASKAGVETDLEWWELFALVESAWVKAVNPKPKEK